MKYILVVICGLLAQIIVSCDIEKTNSLYPDNDFDVRYLGISMEVDGERVNQEYHFDQDKKEIFKFNEGSSGEGRYQHVSDKPIVFKVNTYPDTTLLEFSFQLKNEKDEQKWIDRVKWRWYFWKANSCSDVFFHDEEKWNEYINASLGDNTSEVTIRFTRPEHVGCWRVGVEALDDRNGDVLLTLPETYKHGPARGALFEISGSVEAGSTATE